MSRMLVLLFAFAVSCWTIIQPTEAQPPALARFDAIVSLAEQKMADYRVPGVALGVLDDGNATIRALGVTNVEDPLPITEHTVFPIASISKTFAATVLLRLVEQGKVDLQAPVRKYLPDFQVRDEAVNRDVTIWNLLTHTSGWEGQVCGDDTMKDFVAKLEGLTQVAPPGAAWSYSNAGFCIVGRVIEAVTGMSSSRAMRELLLAPLGLAHAGTTAGDFITYRFALGHDSTGERLPTLQRPFVPSTNLAAGGVGVCITDLLLYARFHMGDGRGASGDRVLSRESLESMRRPQLHKQSTDDDMGIGWHLRSLGSVRVAAHGGSFPGHHLLLEMAPERKFAIGILTNSNNGWRVIQDVERAALSTYLGASLSANQAVAYRGIVETVPAVQVLSPQPDPVPYVGRYLRLRNAVVVRADRRRLFVQAQSDSGDVQPEVPVAFYGPDRAVVTDGPKRGQSIEFIRASNGLVTWIRVVGVVARRALSAPRSNQKVPSARLR